MLADQADYVIGVDTHRDRHSAAILVRSGGLVDQTSATADRGGYTTLLKWLASRVPVGGCGRSRGLDPMAPASLPSLISVASALWKSGDASAATAASAPRVIPWMRSKRRERL